MKYVKGFMMAWGCFSSIPCPYRGWDESARRAMLRTLPLVGILIGMLSVGAWAILDWLGINYIITGVVLTAFYFLMTGFIHLDGFMDCSDAIMSRRPALEERQRILKSSDVGAFAVIAFVLMIMVFAAAMIVLAREFTLFKALVLPAAAAASRSIAVYFVTGYRPMNTSQYREMAEEDHNDSCEKNSNSSAGVLATVFFIVVIPAIQLLYCLEEFEYLSITAVMYCTVPIVAMTLVAIITGEDDIRQLGGMNGDISGHIIVIGEMTALLTAALLC